MSFNVKKKIKHSLKRFLVTLCKMILQVGRKHQIDSAKTSI